MLRPVAGALRSAVFRSSGGRRCALAVCARAAKSSGKGFGTASKALQEIPTITKLEWTSPLQIVKYPDPKLRAVNARIGVFDDSLSKLAKEMIEVMYQDDGVGLAAPQVGVNVRLMVFNPEGKGRPGNESVLVNPEIVEQTGGKELDEEGCLSFPRIYGDVERSRNVVVKAQDAKGNPIKLTLTDPWIARIFQHEYDHLQGVLFHDRMKSTVLETVRPSLVALEEEFLAANPGQAAAVVRLKPPKAKGFGAAAPVKK
ncbi:hypothetical protein HYH03_005749 [Edaphochlamys debaryana]|uniref:Peptide deformylase n=1 Tax=Edaphochlamys debaryana TaxID=47281 RepID=A0A835Y6U8_9CHLO|nr:hypothetical protein HYH03_005749 [Edaphochlamys debaryana]|eukprot:KAG2496147.1 hypothetical protein HYH03_005749 [Edaphochlamys debaryana]